MKENESAEKIEILLNGVRRTVEKTTAGYDEIVALAGLDTGVTYTVVWRTRNSQGTLTPKGSKVALEDGMIVSAIVTGNA